LLPPGTQLTTRNAGDEPLVLYRVTAMPSERWRA
jgi:mannose-6-phosphate isomerase-like protein (cupin superfamily)